MQNTHTFSRDRLAKVAPSIFQESPYQGMSDKYTYIPTIDVVDALADEGWLVTKVVEQRCRTPSRQGYQKHLLRFRHQDQINALAIIDDEVPEIVLINSHDGTSTYKLSAGLFRYICTNGLMVSSSELDFQKIRHTGDVVKDVIEGTYSIVKEMPKVLDHISQSKAIMLTKEEQQGFTAAAMIHRYGKVEDSGFTIDQVNAPRRIEDNRDDLWSTFNRVQENMIKGGLKGIKDGKDGKKKKVSSKEIKEIAQSVGINSTLWSLMEAMRALKVAEKIS